MHRMMIVMALAAAGTADAATGSDLSVIEAERAYAALAQTAGQWTAFRQTAADDAIMFVPEPVQARAWLTDRADPPQAVSWQPAVAFTSCDGSLGVTTGPWQRSSSVGYFTTVWRHQPAGWRWIVDAGDRLETARPPAPVRPAVRRAACTRPRMATAKRVGTGTPSGSGASTDGSLRWSWWIASDGRRHVVVDLWTGRAFDRVIDDSVA